MNGPEHYREAERLLALALKHQENGLVPSAVDICHEQAQVATLALAAATAAPRVEFESGDGRVDTMCADPAWIQVTS